MPLLLLFHASDVPASEIALELTEVLTGRVGGFLELSQMLSGRVPEPFVRLDTYLTGVVPGFTAQAVHPDGTPVTPIFLPGATQSGGVFDLAMSAGGLPVESFTWSVERGQGARMDVTVIGDARGSAVPAVTASAGSYGGAFSVAGTLPEWEWSRDASGQTTVLHGSDGVLVKGDQLPELVPWERQSEKDARAATERAERLAKVPVAQRSSARTDWRRMPVDQVVMEALATVPHRLLAAPPFPGYDFRAHGDGPSYATFGRTAQDVVNDIWGKVGIQAGWEGGVLVIRPPGPTGDLLLPVPIGSERQERITLDTPTLELTGGTAADDLDDFSGDDPDDPDDPRKKDDERKKDDPDSRANSPDPDERKNEGGSGFAKGISPTPEVGEVAATAVPLSWESVPTASQYILERIEGTDRAWTMWSQVTNTTATRWTDDTALPMRTYAYRLRVNAVAFENGKQNVIWQPSEIVRVTTPPADAEGAPGPVTDLTAYYRSETAVGVKWTPPKADPLDQPPPRKPAADRYDVEVRRASDKVLLKKVLVWQSWVLLDGLPVGARVAVSVRSRNGAHAGEEVVLDAQLINLPPAPVGEVRLEAEKEPKTGRNATTIEATWDAASGALRYRVECAKAPVGMPEAQFSWRLVAEFSPEPVPRDPPKEGEDKGKERLHTTVQGEYATRYAVRVRGLNEVGAGAWSPVAYEVTADAPPQPEPDPEVDAFERNPTTAITTSRRTDNFAESTTVWKQAGRVIATEQQQEGRVALVERDTDEATLDPSKSVWLPFSRTTTKNFYELPDWPETLTASVTETVMYDRSPQRKGQESGSERTRVHQEWSPQGWLARRTTEKLKAAWVIGEENDEGEIVARRVGSHAEYMVETWLPVGGGLWLYQRSGTLAALTPTYVPGPLEDGRPTPGEWTHLETMVRPLEGETAVSEDAPPQATQPRKKEDPEKKAEVPPLPRNTSSPALRRYPLDEPWFEVRAPGPTPGDEGPDTRTDGDPDDPPREPPAGPDDPPTAPEGSGDTSGRPEPDEPKLPPDPEKDRKPKYSKTPGGGPLNSSGSTVSSSIPWVRTAAGLARYADMLAQAYGPRIRITRQYLLPTTPPSLDQAVSASASGSAGQFEMTVVTETR